MRRGVGIGSIKRNELIKEKFKSKGTDVEAETVTKLKEKLEYFKKSLEEFARKHKKDITKDPAFRHQFSQMCQKIGVDPLASSKGFWAELLGFGDFYYELAIQSIEICMTTRNQNGGIIELEELCNRLTKLRKRHNKNAHQISKDDVIQSLKKLKHLGKSYSVLEIGKKLVVQSVPCELTSDHTSILSIAEQKARGITIDEISKELEWGVGRVKQAMQLLLSEGFAWVDDQSPKGTEYWFPGLIDQEKIEN